MKRTNWITQSLVVAALSWLALPACDSQVGSNYKGERIAEIVGSLTGDTAATGKDAEVSLIWINPKGDPDTIIGETVSARLELPSNFTLGVYAPPVDEALFDLSNDGQPANEPRIAVAYVAVTKPDISGSDFSDEENVLGIAENHLVLYVESDVTAGSGAESFLHGTPSAGYHVLDVKRISGQDFDELHLSQEDMQTKIPVTLAKDISTLAIPNWH